MKKFLFFLTAFILGLSSAGFSNLPLSFDKQSYIAQLEEEGSKTSKAPDFQLKLTNGKDIKLSDHKGKIVIIDFWATWCPPCRKGIPDLIDIQKRYDKKLVVIGISLDTETKDDVVPFINKFGINYPVAYGNMEVVKAYGNIQAIPTSFIVDQKGDIVDTHVGLVDKSVYVNKIEELLKKKK